MNLAKKYIPGIILTVYLAYLAIFIANFIPQGLISPGVFALIIGMSLNPLTNKFTMLDGGIKFTSKSILKIAIVIHSNFVGTPCIYADQESVM